MSTYTKSQEELLQLIALLNLEKEEEIQQSKELLENTPLEERRKKGFCLFPVILSNEEIGIGEQLLLEFEFPSIKGEGKNGNRRRRRYEHKFQQGQTVSVFGLTEKGEAHSDRLEGVIKVVEDKSIILIVKQDSIPDWWGDYRMGIDMLYNAKTFKEMEFALNRVFHAKDDRLSELREILMGYQDPYFEKLSYEVKFPMLNDSQNQALVEVASARDVALIHGPPGTGKTTTLVRAIKHTLHEQSQVLVCAPSNTAVDLLTQKLVEEGVRVLRMGHPARINDALLSHTFDSKVAAHRDYKNMRQLRKAAHVLKEKARKFKRSFGPEDRENRRAALKEARAMLDDAKGIEKYIVKDVLESAQAITATLVGSSQLLLRYKLYDTVFIDEAGQALEPATWIPIQRAKRVVFAGDHQQLPPTVKSAAAQHRGLEVSLFEKCMRRLKRSTMLGIQYRMHETIMGFSNQEFYNNKLIAHNSVKDQVLGEEELLFTPFDFIDTAGSGYEEKSSATQLSKSNPDEAMALLNYLNNLVEQLKESIDEESFAKLTIGLISPYKAQVRFLREEIADFSHLEKCKSQIAIHTVDGFQGQERDIIAISLVRSNSNGEIGFLKDTRRLNVAMTRAKKKLIVIGDGATISQNTFFQSFLDFAELEANYRTIWEFM